MQKPIKRRIIVADAQETMRMLFCAFDQSRVQWLEDGTQGIGFRQNVLYPRGTAPAESGDYTRPDGFNCLGQSRFLNHS
jgi:hypothetical protein